ncbi:MAG: thioredoxin domain-containing protein [Nitrospirae bacterium]|nr:thioredoxin domain-containing protein [Nitrospirota bacterium]
MRFILLLVTLLLAAPPLPSHADRPIPWSTDPDAALKRARLEHKPILLSMSPPWSYWSRRMETETFTDAKVVRAATERSIPLKLDPDLRPDVASRYLNRGYPITAFLTETGRVIASAQTIDKDHMVRLLDSLTDVYRNYAGPMPPPGAKTSSPSTTPLTSKQVKATLEEWLKKEFDRAHGGFGRGGKNLPIDALEWSLHEAGTTRTAVFEDMALKTLNGILGGTVYDPAQGRFRRSSKDADWSTASAEVLLDDQARMGWLLFFAYQVTDRSAFLDAGLKTIGYMRNDLWSPKQKLFSFGRAGKTESVTRLTSTGPAGPLLPMLLTGSNLRAARALMYAHVFKPQAGYWDQARDVIQRIRAAAHTPGQGIVREIRAGKGTGIRYLEDQVEWASSLLDLYQLTADPGTLKEIEAFVEQDMAQFVEGDLFADLPRADRKGLVSDARFPLAENARIFLLLQSLAALTGEFEYRDRADRLLRSLIAESGRLLTREGAVGTELGLPLVALAILRQQQEPFHISILSPAAHAESRSLLQRSLTWPRPFTLVQALDPSRHRAQIERLGYEIPTRPAAYVCQGLVCLSMVETADKLDAFRKELTQRAIGLQSKP